MIPLRDNIPSNTTPFVNYTVLGLCSIVWLWQLAIPLHGIYEFGMVPARVLGDSDITTTVTQIVHGLPADVEVPIGPARVPEWLTPVTCTFLHGSWPHFLFNMLFLWVYGDNVEDRLGHVGYVAFYLATGAVASLAHLGLNSGSELPTIGASGAIAAVMGAYCHLYPDAKVLTFIMFGFLIRTIEVPARMLLALWFGLQLLSASLALGFGGHVGVAWWAHIGGFAAGFGIAVALGRTRRLRPPVGKRRPTGAGPRQRRRFNLLRKRR